MMSGRHLGGPWEDTAAYSPCRSSSPISKEFSMTNAQETWLWIGTGGMALGAVAIAVSGRSLREDERHHAVASFFVCLIAACAYFAMANGQGIIGVGDREVFVPRYADWLLTTPLLLLGLAMVALPKVAPG